MLGDYSCREVPAKTCQTFIDQRDVRVIDNLKIKGDGHCCFQEAILQIADAVCFWRKVYRH